MSLSHSNRFQVSWLLRAWQQMGGRVIITADAHSTDGLTFGYEEAARQVKAAGFGAVQVLTGAGFERQEL